jgi:hypothetical protein
VAETTELIIKAILALGAAALLMWGGKFPRRKKTLLWLMALISFAAYFNFGGFHGVRYPHYHEHFHYVLGSKYFPELGYDGLYVASLTAQKESAPNSQWPKEVRDLRNNRKVAPSSLEDHRQEVKARFSKERWRSFVVDHQFFMDNAGANYFKGMRRDHGFNPTPSWTFVARIFSSTLPLSRASLVGVALLDPMLLILMFYIFWRTFGSELTCQAMILFGLSFMSRFYWTGGAFLRHDWLAASVIGICLLQKKRWVWAGLAIGFATTLRAFPALLLVGVGGMAIADLRGKRATGWAYRLAFGFTMALAFGFVTGLGAGRGLMGWREFLANIELHHHTWLANNIGFSNLLVHIYDLANRDMATWLKPQSNPLWESSSQALSNRLPLLKEGLALLWCSILAYTSRHREPSRSTAVGTVAIFVAVASTCYYWCILLVIPLEKRRWLNIAILLFNALLCILALTPAKSALYGIAAWLLFGIFIAWTVVLWRERKAPLQRKEP